MSDVSYQEVKDTQDKIAKLLNDFQAEHKTLADGAKGTNEALEKMKGDFAALSEKYQTVTAAIEAEEKARKEMELSIARINEHGDPATIKGSAEYADAFVRYMVSKEGIKNELVDSEIKAHILACSGRRATDNEILALKTLMVGSNPDGGYLVPVDRSNVIKKRIFESTPMRQYATVETTSTEAKEFVLDDGEFDSNKYGELDARGVTATSQIGVITIPVHNQEAMPITTQKALDDVAWNLEAWISGKLAEKFSRQENHEFMVGAAANEAQGILTLADWASLGVYERNALETRALSANPTGDDLINLQSDLLEYYQGNAVWMMHRKTWAEVMKLKDTQGQYLLNPMMIFSGVAMQLLGRPVVMAADMPVPGVDGIPIIYGDMREGYAIVDRIGMRVLRDPYSVKGFVQFYTTKRCGGGVVNFQAIKRLRYTADT